MCCGLGSVWPGMGRELYDHVPAARAMMDRIAAVAGWDVLGLMDETDVEKISRTRWQSPYLFMVELAQWSVLESLGLNPALFCGHSLGELIALCLAGIYTPEVGWYILDTRAAHMAELEARPGADTGMMAVHAERSVIDEAHTAWPDLYISNYNTPRQYILSGPRPVLLEARKSLRKRRIPAMMLNVSLAFHHPGMRVLRDLSLRRLGALDMAPPRRPALSCVTTQFYPPDQPGICRPYCGSGRTRRALERSRAGHLATRRAYAIFWNWVRRTRSAALSPITSPAPSAWPSPARGTNWKPCGASAPVFMLWGICGATPLRPAWPPPLPAPGPPPCGLCPTAGLSR